MKILLFWIYAYITATLTYFVFVTDNVICSITPGTRLPFKDFARNLYARKMAYRRIVTIIVLYFIYWLIF